MKPAATWRPAPLLMLLCLLAATLLAADGAAGRVRPRARMLPRCPGESQGFAEG